MEHFKVGDYECLHDANVFLFRRTRSSLRREMFFALLIAILLSCTTFFLCVLSVVNSAIEKEAGLSTSHFTPEVIVLVMFGLPALGLFMVAMHKLLRGGTPHIFDRQTDSLCYGKRLLCPLSSITGVLIEQREESCHLFVTTNAGEERLHRLLDTSEQDEMRNVADRLSEFLNVDTEKRVSHSGCITTSG